MMLSLKKYSGKKTEYINQERYGNFCEGGVLKGYELFQYLTYIDGGR
jgi:hypothetical protein